MATIAMVIIILVLGITLIGLLVCLILNQCRKPAQSEECSPTLILRNWNPQAGFHYMAGFCVLNALLATERVKGLKLVVLLDSGLYKEDRLGFRAANKCYNSMDWFSYYFEPINQTSKPLVYWKNFVAQYGKRLPPASAALLQQPHALQRNSVYLFDRHLLNAVNPDGDRRKTFHRLWKKYFRVRPHVQRLANDFKRKHGFESKYVVAVHARLTDKWPSKSGTEDFPSRPPKDFWAHLVRDQIAKSNRNPRDVLVFVASDEQPFVDYMKRQNFAVVSIDAIRASVDTSGMKLATEQCDQGVMTTADCRKYNELIDASVHRGMKDKSNYVKGLDVLLDVLLLACGDVILRSRGSVSNSAEWFSKPTTKIVDVTDVYNQQLL